jgi:CheY-like chemotaxis protein
VVLMDVQMPVMDGPAAVREIRAREAASGRSRTPIIALTANAMIHQVSEYIAAGMDGHIAKPIEVRSLFETLARFMPDPQAAPSPDELAPPAGKGVARVA